MEGDRIMYTKRVLAIVCIGVLTAGTGSAFAAENAATYSDQDNSSSNDANGSQMSQSQTWSESGDAKGNDMTKRDGMSQNETGVDQSGTMVQNETMAQSGQNQSDRQQAGGKAIYGEVVRNRQGERLGRIAGVLVGQSGGILGYIVRTGKASGSREKLHVVVPRKGTQTVSRQRSGTDSMTRSGATSKGATRSTADNQISTARRRMLLNWMYQQLQKQAVEIRLLKQQLAAQQTMSSDRGAMLDSGRSGNRQTRSAQNNPLSQVDKIVVDRFGHVEAIVLKSGIVLAPARTGAAQTQASP